MRSETRNRVRQEQTARELRMLSAEFADWIQFRTNQDRFEDGRPAGRHKTQLEALDTVLTEAINSLLTHVDSLRPADTDTEPFYGHCRECDEATVWLRRIWQFFREKFDQREHPKLGPALRAADEVVWSCYRQVFTAVAARDPDLKQGPSPLPYIAPEYSPAALQADRPPSSFNLDSDLPFLQSYLAKLPMPLLLLPPWCVDSPWWLVYVGHEVGHFIQNELRLKQFFAEKVRGAAQAVNGTSKAVVDQWVRWSDEIFADVFSLAVAGPPALWAIAELELGPSEQMLKRRTQYPSPLIRLALMQNALNKLDGLWEDPIRDLNLEQTAGSDERTRLDLQVVPGVVDAALGNMRDNLGTVKEMVKLRPEVFRKGNAVDGWARFLRDLNAVTTERQLETARLVAAGSVKAWIDLTRTGSVNEEQRNALAARTRSTLAACAPPGTRAGRPEAPAKLPVSGSELADLLLKRSRSAFEEPDAI